MNAANETTAKAATVKVTGKPNPPANKARVGALNYAKNMSVTPANTPVSAYIKTSK